MKKKLRILVLCLVSILAVNCSSDDNSSPKEEVIPGKKTKDLKVIDSFVYSSFYDNKLNRKETTTFFYNEDGTVNYKNIIRKSYRGGEKIEKEVVTYTYKNNLIVAFKQETFLTNQPSLIWKMEYVVENNKIVKGISERNGKQISILNFIYNAKGQLINTKNSQNQTEEGITYKYDDRGNLVEVNYDGYLDRHITYDDNKSPYTNMNISNQMLRQESFADHDDMLIHSPNNVTSTLQSYDPITQEYSWIHTNANTYDKENYLETSITEMVSPVVVRVSEIKYTYKTITVPVSN